MQNKYKVLFVSGAILLSGCQLPNPYTGEAENSKATNGAIIGAIGGAAIGVLSVFVAVVTGAFNAVLA